ncbi:hypothetical protein [Bradyrhizobium brasilense]|uniref:hypothetical protein n=1 Tax=Bradyrhizobium brasilense TaxID=1419277 RepID=UPI001E41DEC8|nr:hypothetical protein [Bradyrhizobium brasilense]
MASPGKIQEYGSQAPDTIAAKLFNFEVGKFAIKPEHSNWLISVVAPKLRSGGSLTIIGLASRTGSDDFNMELSQNRLRAVIDLLRKQVLNNFKVALEVAKGERAAKYAGEMDGVENESWRGVIISVWNKPNPPPPPPPQPKPQFYPEERKFFKRWLGFGVKSGGQLLIGGIESTTAYVVNLGDLETFDLQIISSRWGLGLGGSGGAVAVIGFGFSVPYELHREPLNDWGVNVAFTEKLISKSALQSIHNSKYFIDGLKNGRYVAPALNTRNTFTAIGLLQNVRNALHTLYGGFEAAKGSGVIVLDLPFLGVGLELSAFLTRGTMYVSNPSHWIEPS